MKENISGAMPRRDAKWKLVERPPDRFDSGLVVPQGHVHSIGPVTTSVLVETASSLNTSES